MTKYRSVGDGYCRWLEYQECFRFLWMIPIKYWLRVPRMFYDEWVHEGLSSPPHEIYICSYNSNIERFVKQNPNIEDYFNERKNFIKKRKKEVEEMIRYRKSKNAGIKKLN